MIEIKPANSKKVLSDFITLPKKLYKNNNAFVPNLDGEVKKQLSNKNPFFIKGEACYWVAYKNKKAVGRISAQINHAHLEKYNDSTGHFGFLEAGDKDTFAKLLETASAWLKDKKMKVITGPLSFSINEEVGNLIAGFDTTSYMALGYARPEYKSWYEELGYDKEKDLYCYELSHTDAIPKSVQLLNKKFLSKQDYKLRTIDMNNYNQDIFKFLDVYNEAWEGKWGFLPFTDTDKQHLADSMKLIVDPKFAIAMEIDGEMAGMLMGSPNLNELIRDFKGKLFPLNFLKFFYRLKVAKIKTTRIFVGGILKKYHATPLGAAIFGSIVIKYMNNAIAKGYQHGLLGWILEDNRPMRSFIERFGIKSNKTYRVYRKSL